MFCTDRMTWRLTAVHLYHGHTPLVIRVGAERDRARQTNIGTLDLIGLPASADLEAEIQFVMGADARVALTGAVVGPSGEVLLRRSVDVWLEPSAAGLVRIDFRQVSFRSAGLHSLVLLVDSVPAGEAIRFEVAGAAEGSPLLASVPHQCPQCGSGGTVRVQRVISGVDRRTNWVCAVCRTEWPLAAHEGLERRTGPSDRRRTARSTRRRMR